ncbi:homoserine dehydrogenase [Pseudobacteroides cellulosolvens]|uniref:Homoserine dehydrogenase n=1 Tax=Pseudobacteroides cellulosolvens ATCC 35603 = DSM 2933 TaxID=398512 RepID=A0A0L6JQY4_9FIRM|nr:homoserine dehydrogenase [Pseudobacteroides cellulosolvens]KNY28241.1 homoserine dehydrogenase [Pseudobacteroides cellulosolvens ATCC 35603 = DSM 2933]
MIFVAVLGYGVVGSGVVEVIKKNRLSISQRAGEEIYVKKILDIRDFDDCPDKELLTKNSDDVFNDDSISVVVETIGGKGIAYEFTKTALSKGKHVITSNKELVATHGPELLRMAADNNVHYHFEASVGGGIPIIRPLNNCLAANEINGITGILNGTTNYILTQMNRYGKDFNTALKEAQANGYAEADPTADIEGHDACRKIAILSSIAYNEYIDYRKISTEGITKLTLADMHYAEISGSVIKLIGRSERVDGKIYATVSPAFINKSHPLANVEDVFNAIVVRGDAIGDAMFYGRGAGKLPTASAVVADVIDVVKHKDNNGKNIWTINTDENIMDADLMETRFYIRLEVKNRDEAEELVKTMFGQVDWIPSEIKVAKEELVFISEKEAEGVLRKKVKELAHNSCIKEVAGFIRVLED